MQNLFTPWRYAYLSGGRREKGCIFCRARDSKDDRSQLVVFRGRHNFIILNRYPYNSGHLMIVPYEHLAELSRGTPEQLRELMLLAARCESALGEAYAMDGMNLGMNRCFRRSGCAGTLSPAPGSPLERRHEFHDRDGENAGHSGSSGRDLPEAVPTSQGRGKETDIPRCSAYPARQEGLGPCAT
jgi:hypothetical protein